MKLTLINRTQIKLGYVFNKAGLLLDSLTHRENPDRFRPNERLEFLGDSILNYIIADSIYKRFSDINEGGMSRIKSILVRKATLAEIAYKLNLEFYNKSYNNKSSLSNSIEILMGAICLDSSIKAAERLLLSWVYNKLTKLTIISPNKDSKTILQEHLQEVHLSLPTYIIYGLTGEPYNKTIIYCKADKLPNTVIGIGPNRKLAEQRAAYKILKMVAKENLYIEQL